MFFGLRDRTIHELRNRIEEWRSFIIDDTWLWGDRRVDMAGRRLMRRVEHNGRGAEGGSNHTAYVEWRESI
ncbi:MAG: hypothetical protein LBB61_03265 [Treponema sp.]|jgi:hypothetical protein|nr:hypothetical protein [Treponema sp.]